MSMSQANYAAECELPDVLAYLARIDDEETQEVVARNPYTEADTLMFLAKESPYTSVRCHIVFHDNVTPEIIEELSKDSKPAVLASLAMVPKVPEEILESLAKSSNTLVHYALSRNPSASATALAYMAEKESLSMVLANIAKHPNTDPKTLILLSSKRIHCVRLEVARNINTPTFVLMKLAKDIAKDVRESALDTFDRQTGAPQES